MITMLDRRDEGGGVIKGMVTTFTKIDLRGRWFDQNSLDQAAPELVSQINIPDSVHPNSAAFRFALNIRKHILTFEHYSGGKYLVPKSAFTLFRELSDTYPIIDKFGPVKISILQDRSSLDRIFSMTKLKKVTFTLDRPNPDIWSDDVEGQVDAHLAATHAEQLSVTYTAPTGDSLVPTDALRQLGSAALRNGDVQGIGVEGRQHVRISTLDSPKVEQTTYDPEIESEADAFDRLRGWMEVHTE